MSTVTLHIGDVRDVMATLPDNSFDLLVTSPPFLALRSYLPADHPDKHREIGSEPTPAAFLDTLYGLTEDWGRLLPEWASICVELGDTMSGSGGAGGDYGPDGMRGGQQKFTGSELRHRKNKVLRADGNRLQQGPGWPLAKSMCLLPASYAFGIVYGHNPITGTPIPGPRWRLRNQIVWARPNPPVGSLGKRNPHTRTGDHKFRPATSYITVACRGTGRYFDLDAVRTDSVNPLGVGVRPTMARVNGSDANDSRGTLGPFTRDMQAAGAPPLDWHTDNLDGDWLWKLATAPYKGSHYATFPLTLPRRLILAMCPQRVCAVCGWPSERETGDRTLDTYRRTDRPQTRRAVALADQHGLTDEHIAAVRAHGISDTGKAITTSNGHGANTAEVQRLAAEAKAVLGGYFREFVMSTNSTPASTWTDCGHDAWRPGRVLDPFGGSGTTAVAATLEQRDCTLIDLDARNVDLVDRRLREVARVNTVARTETTVEWTLEALPPSQIAALEAGQLELFAEGW